MNMHAHTAQGDIFNLLKGLDPINKLPEDYIYQLLETSKVIEFGSGDFVFRQGDRDNCVYYLLKGSLELQNDGQTIKTLIGNSDAARFRLAQLQPRQMSARVVSPARVIQLDRQLLDHLLTLDDELAGNDFEVNEISQASADDWMTKILQSELFSYLPAHHIQRLFTVLEHIPVSAGDMVIRQGEVGDYYYILAGGRCEVRRHNKGGKEVQLAELVSGDAFGEEALLTGAVRNATVVMLTDGVVMRLKEQDFRELIREPILQAVDFQQAQEMEENGALWIDVRFSDECVVGPKQFVPDSTLNIPLNILRMQSRKLDDQRQYICCCDTGRRSAVAAFLLTQLGIDVFYLDGGLQDTSYGIGLTVTEEQQKQSSLEQSTVQDTGQLGIEAEARAAMLKAELEKMDLRLQEALRLQQIAEHAKTDAELSVQQQLGEEKLKMSKQAKRASIALHENELIKKQLEVERLAAETEAEHQRQLLQTQQEELQAQANEALKLEQSRLESVYEQRTRELEVNHGHKKADEERLRQEAEELRLQLLRTQQEQSRIQKAHELQLNTLREEAEEQSLSLEEAESRRHEIETSYQQQQHESQLQINEIRQLADQDREFQRQANSEFQRKNDEIEQARKTALEKSRQQEQNQQRSEQRLREKFRQQLIAQRRQMEAKFAQNSQSLEFARQEKELAECARIAALKEAEQIVQEYKSQQEQVFASQKLQLQQERQRLEAESLRIQETAKAAKMAMQEAEKERGFANKQIDDLKATQIAAEFVGSKAVVVQLNREIVDVEARVKSADQRLRLVTRVKEEAEDAKRDIVLDLVRQTDNENVLQKNLEAELEEWLINESVYEEMNESLLEQKDKDLKRIMVSAKKAKTAAKAHDLQLITDLEMEFN